MASDWRAYLPDFIRDLDNKGCLSSPWLRDALSEVPRHCFIDEYYGENDVLMRVDPDTPTDEQLRLIYSDSGLMIRRSPHSAATQPSLVLSMLEDLDVRFGQKVLEVGTGSGWNVGLLAFGVGSGCLVYSMDIQPGLVDRARSHLRRAGIHDVNLRAADAGRGWPEAAPFDRIVVTVGCPDIPPAWRDQLAGDGVLLIPLKTGPGDPILRLRKQDGYLIGGFTGWAGFMTLQGDYWTEMYDRVSSPGEPWLEELLAGDPTIVELADAINKNLLFFVHLKGVGFRTLQGRWNDYLHSESSSVFSVSAQQPQLRLYGDPSLASLLLDVQKEWIALGRPTIVDYEVEIGGDDALGGNPRTWVDERPHARLTFSLRNRP